MYREQSMTKDWGRMLALEISWRREGNSNDWRDDNIFACIRLFSILETSLHERLRDNNYVLRKNNEVIYNLLI
jgi:hypothetical protein